MTMHLNPNERYDLPAVFGPSPFPDVTSMGQVQSISIPFVTEPEAMAAILPPFFEPAETPLVSVTHSMNRDVDYMGGRGYNLVRVGLAAVFRGETETVVGPYAPVIWESDTAPIVLGRERGGYAKIFGRIPDVEQTDAGSVFECYEYDARLIRAEVTDWRPGTADELAAARQATSTAVSLGWKYIPGTGLEPDANYPMRLVAHYDYHSISKGNGTVHFESPGPADAPYSSHILAVLSKLPVLRYEPATVTSGSMKLPRTGVKRLS